MAYRLQANFLEDIHGSVKKTDLYEEYEAFCKMYRQKPKDPNTFGKYVLRIFPSAYPSRLGSVLDGSQAHCYSGISRRRNPPEEPMHAMEIEECLSLSSSLSSSMGEEFFSLQSDDTPQVDPELEALVEAMLEEADRQQNHCSQQQQHYIFSSTHMNDSGFPFIVPQATFLPWTSPHEFFSDYSSTPSLHCGGAGGYDSNYTYFG